PVTRYTYRHATTHHTPHPARANHTPHSRAGRVSVCTAAMTSSGNSERAFLNVITGRKASAPLPDTAMALAAQYSCTRSGTASLTAATAASSSGAARPLEEWLLEEWPLEEWPLEWPL